MIDNKYENFTDMLDEEWEDLDVLKEDTDPLEVIDNYIFNLYVHLLKYLNQKNKQTQSWISSIRVANSKIQKAYKEKGERRYNNKCTFEFLNDLYIKAVAEAAEETGVVIKVSPGVGDKGWNAKFIRDINAIKALLYENAGSDYVRRTLDNVF